KRLCWDHECTGLRADSVPLRNLPTWGDPPHFRRRSGYEPVGETAEHITEINQDDSVDQNHRTVGFGALLFIWRLGAVANGRIDLWNRSGFERRRDLERQSCLERRKNRHYEGSHFDQWRHLLVSGFGGWIVRGLRNGGGVSNIVALQHLC